MVGGCYASQPIQPITITFPNEHSNQYERISTAQQMEQFVFDCTQGNITGIVTPTFDEATKILISNTLGEHYDTIIHKLQSHQLTPTQLNSLVMITWVGYNQFSPVSPLTSSMCLNILTQLAPTNFELAQLLLQSQTNPDLTPTAEADWDIIGSAIYLLKNERNGQRDQAIDILQTLKALTHNPYDPLLGDWRPE
jgi:hypothetical protein